MNQLIRDLSWVFSNECDNMDTKVSTILQNSCLTPDDYKQWVKFNASHYTYSTIYKNDDYELLLLTWLPYQETMKHPHLSRDNTPSHCWYKILTGKMHEFIFCNECKSIDENVHTTGDVVFIHDSIGKHKMVNDVHLTISLHVYAPPLRSQNYK
jgi:hypothetical protein